MANLADNLFKQAESRGGHPALWFGEHCFTFHDIATQVRRVAGGLAAIGVGPGTRVGLMLTSRPEFIIYQQAVFALGATLSPLNTFYRATELLHAIRSCGLDILIVEELFMDRVTAATAGARALKAILTPSTLADAGRAVTSIEELCASAAPIAAPVQVSSDTTALILNTSATTGTSKSVMLSVGNVIFNYGNTPAWLGLTAETVTLCALPLYNTFGLNQCINALMVTGGSMVLLPRFDAAACIDSIERHRCTFLPAVPTMLQKIFDHSDLPRHHLASLERIMTGGAPVPGPLLERIHHATGHKTTVLTGYGLTEATALVTLTEVELEADGKVARPKTIGKVLDGMQLTIQKEDGSMAAAREVGEICLRGPNIMQGYHQLPDETATALSGGWLHTGDLGCLDEDGFAYIVDRKKDLIIRGGQNIYPADIEEAIYRLSGVREVAVIRRPDELFGEVPVAFLAVDSDTPLDAEHVIAHCKAELAYFKVPAAVHFLPELPKGPTGKILRHALGAPYDAAAVKASL